MTALALIAVLPGAAERTLGEPGTTCIAGSGLAGLCVPAPDLSTVEGARDAVLRQHDLLVRVALAHDLVPVRSGAVFSDPGRVARTLAARAEAYHALLDRVAGMLELTLTIGAPPVSPRRAETAATGGLAYLRARRPGQTADDGQAAHQMLADALATGAQGLPTRPQAGPDLSSATATVLVPRPRLAATLAALDRWTTGVAAPRGAQVRLLGPWPCYVFTTVEVGHAAS